MDMPESLLVRLRAPAGGVVADVQLIEAAKDAANEIERLRGWFAFIENSAGLTSDKQRQVAGAALEGKPEPYTRR